MHLCIFFDKVITRLLLCILLLIGCRGNLDTDVEPESEKASESVANVEPVTIAASQDGQRIYHIDPSQSEASYSVDEILFGTFAGRTVVGATSQVSGQMMIDWSQPSNSRLGVVEVDLTTLKSDSTLRDQRIRGSYLESNTYPLAIFVPDHDAIDFPTSLSDGQQVRSILPGNLTLRDITRRVEWDVRLTVGKDEVVGSAELEIQMSDFEVGPISIVGLLETENEMILKLNFVATVDEATPIATAPEPVDEVVAVAPVEGAPEFFADIEPILADNCVSCHAVGQIGHGVYAMDTARDVIAVADDLAFVTHIKNMPPWPLSANNPPVHNERTLTDNEIELIGAWAAAGAPIDGDLNTPLVATAVLSDPIRSDVIMQMPEPFTPSLDSTDDYRCYVLDPKIEGERFVSWFSVFLCN